MDSVNRSSPTLSRLARRFANVLHIQSAKTINKDPEEQDEKLRNKATMAAFIAKVFATLSSLKAAYAQLQYSQSPYDPEGIQSADQIIVTEFKTLSELKQSYFKNHIDDASHEITVAEIQELKNLSKLYDITHKNLERRSHIKHSKIIVLKEKLEEAEIENKLIERRLYSNLDYSRLSHSDFVSALKHTMKSVRTLVKLLITEMEYANWDLDSAAESIQPDVVYWKTIDRFYAFESFVCMEMFDGFSHRNFSVSNHRRFFFDGFTELKYLKAREYITWKPTSTFAEFCWLKYLRLVHPKMELSLFGNLNQRKMVDSGKFPETEFFETFAEVAKRVWLLHCLAFLIDEGGASMFQVKNGSRFSEVFMECVNEEDLLSPESFREVGFTVVPGFKLGKTIVQCQVYLS